MVNIRKLLMYNVIGTYLHKNHETKRYESLYARFEQHEQVKNFDLE